MGDVFEKPLFDAKRGSQAALSFALLRDDRFDSPCVVDADAMSPTDVALC